MSTFVVNYCNPMLIEVRRASDGIGDGEGVSMSTSVEVDAGSRLRSSGLSSTGPAVMSRILTWQPDFWERDLPLVANGASIPRTKTLRNSLPSDAAKLEQILFSAKCNLIAAGWATWWTRLRLLGPATAGAPGTHCCGIVLWLGASVPCSRYESRRP